MKSLFFRMRAIHYLGIALLLFNAYFFTDNPLGEMIQYSSWGNDPILLRLGFTLS